MDANGINASKMEVAKQPGLAMLFALRIFFFVEFAQAENEFTIAEYRIVAEIVSKIDDLARFRNGILLQKSAGDTVSEAKKNYIGMSNIVGKAEIGFA